MTSLGEYKIKGPEWARGCTECRYGIVMAPDMINVLPLVEGRAGQAHEGLIHFCNCKAGHLYRQQLRRVYSRLSMEMKRNIWEHINAVSVPSIHLEVE